MSRFVLPLASQYSTSASRIVSLKDCIIASSTPASETSRITISQSSSAVRSCSETTSWRVPRVTVSARGSPCSAAVAACASSQSSTGDGSWPTGADSK